VSNSHRIAVIGGDGIGPAVVAEGLRVARAAGVTLDATDFDLGADRWRRDGVVLDDATLTELRGYDAIFLGAVGAAIGSKDVPAGLIERGLLLKLRFELDLYVNLRPFRSSPQAGRPGPGIDLKLVREGTEGSYAGEGGFLRKGTPQEIATQGSVNTRLGVERCIRFAFELAQERPRRSLTLVHKTNVLTFAGDLWQRTFDDVAAEFPEVSTGYHHVDAACMYLVDRAEQYDVIVTDNLFGDILADLAGAVAGGLGRAASANLNPARTGPSLFEPVHGTAHDIVGTEQVDPTAAILSAAMMLEHLGETEPAARIRKAVDSVLTDTPQPVPSHIGDLVAERL
jgi:3-isopropylmalate dehydrogenase